MTEYKACYADIAQMYHINEHGRRVLSKFLRQRPGSDSAYKGEGGLSGRRDQGRVKGSKGAQCAQTIPAETSGGVPGHSRWCRGKSPHRANAFGAMTHTPPLATDAAGTDLSKPT